jgi:GGDEF domain-containing protein
MHAAMTFGAVLNAAHHVFGHREHHAANAPARDSTSPAGSDDESLPSQALQGPPADKQAMCETGEQMLRSARKRDEPFSILVLELFDLPELELVFGQHAACEAVNGVMNELEQVSGTRGFVARADPDTFVLLMPGTRSEDLMQSLRARMGKACCIEFEVDGEEIVEVPDVMARTLSPTDTVEESYRTMRNVMEADRRLEECRRLHLLRERESYTAPTVPPPAAKPLPKIVRELAKADQGSNRPWHIAATIPVPLPAFAH